MLIGLGDNRASSLQTAAAPGPRIAVASRQTPSASDMSKLTEAQRDCLRLVYQHMTSKDIGRALDVSSHTVDMRLRIAIKTLNVANRLEAAQLLAQHEAIQLMEQHKIGSDVQLDTHQLQPRKKTNSLGFDTRFAMVILVAFGSAVAFGAIVAALNTLRVLIR